MLSGLTSPWNFPWQYSILTNSSLAHLPPIVPIYFGGSPKRCFKFAHRPVCQTQLLHGVHHVLLLTTFHVFACLLFDLRTTAHNIVSSKNVKCSCQRCHCLGCDSGTRFCAEEERKALSLIPCCTWSCGTSANLSALRVLSFLSASGLYPHSESQEFSHENNDVSIWHSFLGQSLKHAFGKIP